MEENPSSSLLRSTRRSLPPLVRGFSSLVFNRDQKKKDVRTHTCTITCKHVSGSSSTTILHPLNERLVGEKPRTTKRIGDTFDQIPTGTNDQHLSLLSTIVVERDEGQLTRKYSRCSVRTDILELCPRPREPDKQRGRRRRRARCRERTRTSNRSDGCGRR